MCATSPTSSLHIAFFKEYNFTHFGFQKAYGSIRKCSLENAGGENSYHGKILPVKY